MLEASSKTINIFGLSMFVSLSAEERVQKFQALLGGSRILNRINKVLDQEWPSAAHGFAM
jgi:hypothetical protein